MSRPCLSVNTSSSDRGCPASTLAEVRSVCSPWSQFKHFARALTAVIEARPSPLAIMTCHVKATLDPPKNNSPNVPLECPVEFVE